MRKLILTAVVALTATSAFAQLPNPYGTSINLENAKKIAALSMAEAAKNNFKMAIAKSTAVHRPLLFPIDFVCIHILCSRSLKSIMEEKKSLSTM